MEQCLGGGITSPLSIVHTVAHYCWGITSCAIWEIYINPTTCQAVDSDRKLTSVAQKNLSIFWLKPMTFECFEICILYVSHLTRAYGTAECAHYWTTNISDTSFFCKICPCCIFGTIYLRCICPSLVNTNNCNGFWPLHIRCVQQSES